MADPDRRVVRTRQRLQQALIELIEEKGYDRITVGDLTERADVGRSTFYAHYATMDDLLVAGLDHLTADMEMQAGPDADDDDALPSLGLFRHVAEHHTLFRALIGSRGIDLVQRAALQLLTDMARERLDARGGTKVPADVAAGFVAGALMAQLAWWLDNDRPYTPDQMAGYFRELTSAV